MISFIQQYVKCIDCFLVSRLKRKSTSLQETCYSFYYLLFNLSYAVILKHLLIIIANMHVLISLTVSYHFIVCFKWFMTRFLFCFPTAVFYLKDKSVTERVHDTPNHRTRRYKRASSFDSRKHSFDSRKIVLLFSLL